MKTPGFVDTVLRLLPLNAALLLSSSPAQSAACDGSTWCAWERTWHAPYALNMPLREYYIPRRPGRCGTALYADGAGYAMGCGYSLPVVMPEPRLGLGTLATEPAPASALCDPVRFERLGQIPNDLAISIEAPPRSPSR